MSATARLGRAAASEAPVLVLGEPGSGRTRFARDLHAAGPRATGPLVDFDVAVVPTTLFESELFGYAAGAFTGATLDTAGRVERAAGGTLVLDHVESIPIDSQPKLLRLLAERVYAPLGGAEREADVRFIAVGPPDLPERAARGTFREDLYYRLEVLTFTLAPLRERRDELPAILDAMLEDLGDRFGRDATPGVSARARRWMAEHDWPGNLRELRNVLERALILAPRARELDPKPPLSAAAARPLTLAESEREQIRRALAHTRGHQGKAAELLGISRKALWAKRRRYGIP